MTKHDKDTAFFVAFCIEEYKTAKGMEGPAVLALFEHYGLTDYLSRHYDVLHTQSRQWILEDIDEFIEKRR